jgi:hypothetical protein
MVRVYLIVDSLYQEVCWVSLRSTPTYEGGGTRKAQNGRNTRKGDPVGRPYMVGRHPSPRIWGRGRGRGAYFAAQGGS